MSSLDRGTRIVALDREDTADRHDDYAPANIPRFPCPRCFYVAGTEANYWHHLQSRHPESGDQTADPSPAVCAGGMGGDDTHPVETCVVVPTRASASDHYEEAA